MLSVGAKLVISSIVAVLLAGRFVRVTLHRFPKRISNGYWEVISTPYSDIFIRAYLAKHAPLGLAAREAIYFSTDTDAAGRVLRADRAYRIEGRDFDAEWWNLTVYANAGVIPNPKNRYSFTNENVRRDTDGNWTIFLSPREHPWNWLPSGESDAVLTVALRCYLPGANLLRDPGSAALPRIIEDSR